MDNVCMYIDTICVILAVIIMILYYDRIKDISDDLQLIRMRAFTPKEEINDSITVEKDEISNKQIEKALSTHSKDIRDLYAEMERVKEILNEHSEKLDEIYIEE